MMFEEDILKFRDLWEMELDIKPCSELFANLLNYVFDNTIENTIPRKLSYLHTVPMLASLMQFDTV